MSNFFFGNHFWKRKVIAEIHLFSTKAGKADTGKRIGAQGAATWMKGCCICDRGWKVLKGTEQAKVIQVIQYPKGCVTACSAFLSSDTEKGYTYNTMDVSMLNIIRLWCTKILENPENGS